MQICIAAPQNYHANLIPPHATLPPNTTTRPANPKPRNPQTNVLQSHPLQSSGHTHC